MNGPKLTERDLVNAKSLACESCGNKTFNNVFVIKYISAIMSPNGHEVHAPVPTFACAKCSHINKGFLPPDGETTEGE